MIVERKPRIGLLLIGLSPVQTAGRGNRPRNL